MSDEPTKGKAGDNLDPSRGLQAAQNMEVIRIDRLGGSGQHQDGE